MGDLFRHCFDTVSSRQSVAAPFKGVAKAGVTVADKVGSVAGIMGNVAALPQEIACGNGTAWRADADRRHTSKMPTSGNYNNRWHP